MPEKISVTSISFNHDELELIVGDIVELDVTIQPTNATNKTVEWSSSNNRVATVRDGVVTAYYVGSTDITAKIEGKSAKCRVSVIDKHIAVTSIELNRNKLTMKEGESATLSATVKPENATDKTIIWSSTNPQVATVDKGTVLAVQEGQTIIYATCGDKTAACEVTVEKKAIPVSSISLNQTSLKLIVGESYQLTATVSPNDASDMSIHWSSSDNTVAIVKDGVVTAIARGEVDIKAIAGEKSALCHIQVEQVDAVDMGLSVLWGRYNLGATYPEAAGDYYAWGELEPKSSYSWVNYRFRTYGDTYENTKYSKYVTDTQYGNVDYKTELEEVDDAARQTLGLKWRIPTYEEFQELFENSTSSWCTINSVKGVKFTSNKPGYTDRWVFFPAAGYSWGTTLSYEGDRAWYLSATLSHSRVARGLSIKSSNIIELSGVKRAYGVSIRAVYGDPVVFHVERVSLDYSYIELIMGESFVLNASILPSYAKNKDVVWSSSNPQIATVDQSGLVTAIKEGTADISVTSIDTGITAKCTISVKLRHVTAITLSNTNLLLFLRQKTQLTATIKPDNANNKNTQWSSSNSSVATVDQSGLVTAVSEGIATISVTALDNGMTASCSVTVSKMEAGNAVDLGLSVKWASTNLGAVNPEDTGAKIAWGETEPKDKYNWYTYKFYNHNAFYTKYCLESFYGLKDDKTTLEAEDDAATVNLGKGWRMPTRDEMIELKNKCTWTKTTSNGVSGYNVVSKVNGRSIFMTGEYWSSTLGSWSSDLSQFSAVSMRLGSSAIYIDNYCYSSYQGITSPTRVSGLSIRPVYVQ